MKSPIHLLTLLFAATLACGAAASPGAHGPNGEHLDGPAATAAGGSVPRVETFSEDFELVGELSGGELSIVIDRYQTNEPVLGGQLEVQYKGMKAAARFHADMGDYAVDDPALLKALAAPGKHPLLFTLIAGDDSDLLEGTLVVASPVADEHDHDHDHSSRRWWLAGGAVAVVLVAALVVRARRNKVSP